MDNFTVGKIKRSLQRFSDYVRDLSNADMNTFDDRLSLLMSYCKSDQVFQVIDSQLKSVSSVDFDSWYEARIATVRGMQGSGQLTFPNDLEERLSIMYQLLDKVNDGNIHLLSFSNSFFAVSDSKINSRIYAFNEAIVDPLARELSYRFEDLIEELPDNQKDPVPIANVQIIHNANNVIQQSASGSGITQNATIEQNSELETLFDQLKKEISASIKDESEKIDSIEIADSAMALATQEPAKLTAAGRLLKSLPTLGNIGSIVSTILTVIQLRNEALNE